jgi:hypothetical protein
MDKLVLIAVAIENYSVVLGNCDVFGNTQSQFDFFWRTGGVLESDSCFLTDKTSSSEDGDILQNGLAVVSEGRSFNCHNLQVIFESVKDEASQKLALYIFSNDNKRFLFLVGQF